MTGFGRAQAELNDKKLTVEIKSLNGKQMDLSTRIPSLLREKDLEIRSYLTQRLIRGKVDFLLYIEAPDAAGSHEINPAVVASYRRQLLEMEPSLRPAESLEMAMRLPEVFKGEREELTRETWDIALQTVARAVDALTAYRANEGQTLHRELTSYIENIRSLAAQVEPFEKSRIEQIRQRLYKHLSETGVKIDENRFEQEIIFYLEKLDVTEEKVRLGLHLDYFLKTLNGEQQEGCGKKLGFIAQEIGREINTLGSKSNQADMQKIVVRMKDELEKIKEQSLNVL